MVQAQIGLHPDPSHLTVLTEESPPNSRMLFIENRCFSGRDLLLERKEFLHSGGRALPCVVEAWGLRRGHTALCGGEYLYQCLSWNCIKARVVYGKKP